MKNFFALSLLALGFGLIISSCGNNSENPINDDEDVAVEKDEIDKRFQTCYYEDDFAKRKSDSVLISIFGKTLFNRNIRFDLANSFLNCQVEGKTKLVPFGDKNYCVANTFDLVYSIVQNKEEIYSFRMVAGNEMEFEPVSTIVEDQFEGYKALLKGAFNVNYSKAKSIAIRNGVSLEEADLELVKNETESLSGKLSYHWEAELKSDENSIVLLLIDVMSGETSKEVLLIENVE